MLESSSLLWYLGKCIPSIHPSTFLDQSIHIPLRLLEPSLPISSNINTIYPHPKPSNVPFESFSLIATNPNALT